MSQKLSLGRIVLFTLNKYPDPGPAADGYEARAAVVVRVNADGTPVLRVFGDTPSEDYAVGVGASIQESAAPGTPEAFGCWSWPPRV